MSKIKFNCPSCDAKLKVPMKLAGVAGPCPKCGGTIVAPLRSQEPDEEEVHAEPAEAAPQLAPPPITHAARHSMPPANPPAPSYAPAAAAAIVAPAAAVAQSAQPVGFPQPLEAVSQTAAVALASSPVGHAPGPMPDAGVANTLPEPQSTPVLDAISQTATYPASRGMPEDIFDESPRLNTPIAPPEATQPAYSEPVAPKTQPILVKKNREVQPAAEEVVEPADVPRLDVSLAEAGAETLTRESVPETTLVQPSDPLSVNEASSDALEGYNPPNPVALTPPALEPDENLIDVPDVDSGPIKVEDINFDGASVEDINIGDVNVKDINVEEIPDQPIQLDADLPSTDQGSVAAFLSHAIASGPVSDIAAPGNSGDGKSKDEILEELLGTAPKRKTKGLSITTKLMIGVFVVVLIGSIVGVGLAIQKAGGLNASAGSVRGSEGEKNIETRDKNLGIATEENTDLAADGSEVPERIDVSSDSLTELANSDNLKAPDISDTLKQTLEPVAIPAPEPFEPEVIRHPIPGPGIPEVAEFVPQPSYAARTDSDPELHNTHDLIDSFLRASDWEARVPYIYRGDSFKSGMRAYYNSFADFGSMVNYSRKIFQYELDPKYGGPFWVFQVTKDNEEAGIPVIIRPENGNLKVDWEAFSEFTDQHFVKFRQGIIKAPREFRLVAERVRTYTGTDHEGFTDKDKYDCYELNTPYGAYKANSEFAFINKSLPLARKMAELIEIGEDPLALIVEIDVEAFNHGVNHLVIKNFVSEGWLK